MSTTRKTPAAKATTEGAAAPAAAKAPTAKRVRTKPAPAVAGSEAKPVVEATKKATVKENPASTTRANDPARDATVNGTTTAEVNAGLAQEQAPDAPEHTDLQAAGNRHSHAAETEAERSVRLSEISGKDLTANAASAFPAGADADPAKQPKPGEVVTTESRHDESGALQDATRLAIGAGAGAPDGVGDDGADPDEAEVNRLADEAAGKTGDEEEVQPGLRLAGGQLKLYRALEQGGSQDELLKATGWRSVQGTINVLSRFSGREVEKTKGPKGETVYRFAALPETSASV